MCQDMVNIGFLRISGILGFFWGFYPKNPTISKNPENRKIHILSKTIKNDKITYFFELKKIKNNLKIGIFQKFSKFFQKSQKPKNPP